MKPVKLLVGKYLKEDNAHKCTILSDDCEGMIWCKGDQIRVDLMVNGDFPGADYHDLVGKTVTVEDIFPYVSIGSNVKIVDDEVIEVL